MTPRTVGMTTRFGMNLACTSLAMLSMSSAVLAEPDAPAAPAKVAAPEKKAEPLGLKVGDKAPAALTLKNAKGESVALSSLMGKGPVVVTFYRGGWCPFCNGALKAWQEKLPELEKAGGTLVAITPETPDNAAKTTETDKLTYTVLSDSDESALKAFKVGFEMDAATQTKYKGYGIDLAKHNASGQWKLPHPGTFVINPSGVITYASVSKDYTKRADPAEAIAAVKAITKK